MDRFSNSRGNDALLSIYDIYIDDIVNCFICGAQQMKFYHPTGVILTMILSIRGITVHTLEVHPSSRKI